MGIRFTCPNDHKLHVKEYLAGKRGLCPECGVSVLVPEVPGAASPAARPAVVEEATGEPEAAAATAAIPLDTGPPSIVISVADASSGPSDFGDAPASTAASPNEEPDPVERKSEAVPLPLPGVVEPKVEPLSPAARYAALRERNRRNRAILAVVLLAAVILLALVLIWVLGRNAGQPVARPEQVSFPAPLGASPIVAMNQSS